MHVDSKKKKKDSATKQAEKESVLLRSFFMSL